MTAAAPRPPVVLLHALGLDSAMWDAQRRALDAAGHHVIAVDQRGFGSTPLGGAPARMDVVADDLAVLLDAQGIDRFALVGISMGGYAALAFLRRYRGRIGHLVLMSTRAAADTPAQRAEREAFAKLITDEQAAPRLVAASVPKLVGATTRASRPEVVAAVTAMVEAAPPESLAWAQRAIALRPDMSGLLRAADLPATVLAGAEDELVSPAEQRAMAESLPNGRLVTIPDAGHLPPLETPDAVTEALLAALRTDRTAVR